MILNKTIGYILLAVGLILIFGTLWQTYNIFFDKTSAPLVFKTPNEIGTSSEGASVQEQINNAVQNQLNKALPMATITKLLNLTAWSMLAFILVVAGGTVSGIGVKLINGKS
ncbi:MAG: hypothetical protein Q8Q48_00385 [Candidatus Staskawiczbacteria bacterium]|nr:hypothetical protein [Candidatus Staskawiczbacteria bacterium]